MGVYDQGPSLGAVADYLTPSLYLGQSANRCFVPRSIIAGADVYAKTEDVLWTNNGGYPRVGWARWVQQQANEVTPAGDGTIIVRMEYPAGVYTYARQNIDAGAPGAPAPVPHATGTTILLDFDTYVPAGAAPRFRVIQRGNGVVFRQGQAADQAAPGCYLQNSSGTPPAMEAAFPGQPGEYSCPPILYLTMTRKPSVLQFGDSREETGSEAGRPPYYVNGLTLPAIWAAGIGFTCLTESGTALRGNAGAGQFLGGTYTRRLALAQYFSHIEDAYGFNDLNAYGRSVAQLLTDRATFAALFPNNVVFGTTMMLSVTSTDAYVNTANQGALGANQLKVREANTAIRRGIVGEAFVIDTADASDPLRTSKYPVSRDPAATSRSTSQFTGSIAANGVLTVTAITSGTLNYGDPITDSLTSITDNKLAGCTILEQLTGSAGSTGTYTISRPQTLTSRTLYVGGYACPDTIHQTKDFSEQIQQRIQPQVNALIRR